jgi:hypothetical protein
MVKFIFSLFLFAGCQMLIAQETNIKYLSGTDKDHTVQWDFNCSGGRNSGKWTTIAVPSCWELQGFGVYNYGYAKNPADEKGLYHYKFNVPAEWKGKQVFIVFDGSMTDTEVKINGKVAGPIHQGAFYRFRYNITNLLKVGAENLLEVTVSKISSNISVNRAERESDFWVFGGIFRPVFLEAYPSQFIERTAIDAKADGSFNVDVYFQGVIKDLSIEAQISDATGKPAGNKFAMNITKGAGFVRLNTNVISPTQWNPEWPYLYKVDFWLKDGSKILHHSSEKFGFRTMELRLNDGIYVNGQRVVFRGVNRHSFWPTSGRTVSKQISIDDVNLMKEMNMNAVRMSHYPPDKHFLEVCDSLGMFVLDELAGWQKYYDTEVGKKLVKEMVLRDVNHPCIILWDNGNEGGFNFDLDDEFAKYDPQKRQVIHPWEGFRGISTHHYKPYNYGMGLDFGGREPFFETEFLHGLFDGGHGASLDDYWKLMMSNPLAAGAFLWVFADEGIVRTDLNGTIDIAGNSAPDGIVGPYREKEGSFFTIKEIWSPAYIDMQYISPAFTGKLKIENRFLYTSFTKCKFSYKVLDYPLPDDTVISPKIVAQGEIPSPALQPGELGFLDIPLPSGWKNHGTLEITAYYPDGKIINSWSWPIKSAAAIASEIVQSQSTGLIGLNEDSLSLQLEAGGVLVKFSKKTGLLEEVRNLKGVLPFNKGPQIAWGKSDFKSLKHYKDGNNYVVEVITEGNTKNIIWRMQPNGWLRLDYDYSLRGEMDYAGINFSFPEDQVTGMRWLGRGPYRVWKNRLKGIPFGLYHKDYNNTVTGETWEYPEFKGYHSELYWVTIENKISPFTVVSATDDLFLRMLTPQRPKDAPGNNYVVPDFPSGDISFLQGISPIGTKFDSPKVLGPQGQKNMMYAMKGDVLKTILYFDFRAKK